tara:strand:- start:4075 stop:4638 length:564 start_codon:yes stop_codon:yes gene_type:complete
MTTRLTNDTYYELKRYKQNNNMVDKCIFNIPIKLRYKNVAYDYPLIVLEMNNSRNAFIGMGFILNRTSGMCNSYDIYSNKNYNRYTYKSRFYIKLGKQKDDYINYILPNEEYVSLFERLTNICFYGKGHLKRGSSFTAIPMKHITKDINSKLMEIFLLKYKNDMNMLLNLTTVKELKEETKKKILNM